MMNFSSESSSSKVTLQVPSVAKEQKESPIVPAYETKQSHPTDLKDALVEKLKDPVPALEKQSSQSTMRKVDMDKAIQFYRQKKQ